MTTSVSSLGVAAHLARADHAPRIQEATYDPLSPTSRRLARWCTALNTIGIVIVVLFVLMWRRAASPFDTPATTHQPAS